MVEDKLGRTAFGHARLSMENGKTTRKLISGLCSDYSMQLNPIYHRKRTFALLVRLFDLQTWERRALFSSWGHPNHRIDAERHPLLDIAITEEDLAMVRSWSNMVL